MVDLFGHAVKFLASSQFSCDRGKDSVPDVLSENLSAISFSFDIRRSSSSLEDLLHARGRCSDATVLSEECVCVCVCVWGGGGGGGGEEGIGVARD